VALLVALIAGVVLGAVIIAPVLVSSAATGIEAQVGQLEAQQEELSTATSGLAARISAMSSPDRIAEQAAQLGLGPAQSVQYMSAGDEPVGTEGDTTVAGR
jgi:cell division protein FtsL